MEEYMKAVWKIVVSLSVLAMVMSCSSPSEKKGDAAYRASQKLEGNQKRLQLKTAYMMYDKAIKDNPDKASPKLKNRFIEMALTRANMIREEGAAHMEAIPLIREDIEKFIGGTDIQPDLKQQYAIFLTQLADSAVSKERYDDALDLIDSAIIKANDPSPIKEKRKELTAKLAQENYEMADMDYNNGKLNEDEEDMIRAEFWALTALYFDSTHEEAKKLLSTLRKTNVSTYSAYLRVVDPIPDSTIFKKINKYDILLAVPTTQRRGKTIRAIVDIYNYSYNPLRLRTTDFTLIDVNGNRYKAMPGKVFPEMLDQEHEAKLKMTFPAPKAEIEKLVYENGDHLSEKFFK